MKGFYFIENTVDEWRSRETAYFSTLREAKEAMKYCSDWYLGEGTGRIYYQEFGIDLKITTITTVEHGKVMEKTHKELRRNPRKFICRGKGLDENGNVIFTEKEF